MSDWSVIESDKLISGDIEIIIGDAWNDIGMDESYVTVILDIFQIYIDIRYGQHSAPITIAREMNNFVTSENIP